MNDEKSISIVPRTFTEVQTMSEVLSKSSLLPEPLKGKAADVAFQIMTGAELGLGPLASIRGIYIIQGKPTIAADTMMALCLGSGLCEYFVQIESTTTSVTFETKRKGSPHPQRCTWTMEDAKRAALHQKDTWRAHPRQMLASRAKAELARSAYPDVLAGCFDPDELTVPSRGSAVPVEAPPPDVLDAEFVDADPPEVTAIDNAETIEALKAQADIVSKLSLTARQKQDLNARYVARLKWLKAQPAPTATEPATTEPAA